MGRTKSKQSSSSSSSFWYSRSRSASAPTTPRPEPAADDPPIGCMSMVHYLIFAPGAGCVGRPPSSSNAIVTPHNNNCHDDDRRRHRDKMTSGFEAPRNSLELDADNPNDIQIGVQIEPAFDALANSNLRRHKPTAPSSEAETPRTPSLVARLMGIDGLPDQASPSPATNKKPSSKKHADDKENCYSPAPAKDSSGKEKKKRVIPESMNRREPLRSLSCNVEARSLPETPRGSTSAMSARASWDGPRLSLQALKETVLDRAAHYMSMPSSPTSAAAGGRKKKDGGRRRRDERERERLAKEHAREILRQAKENVASRNKSSSSSKNKSSSSSPAPEKRNSSSRSSFFDNKENVQAPPPPAVMEDKLVVVVQKPPAVVARAQQGGAEHPPASHSPRVPLAPRQPPPPQRAKPSRPPPPPPPLDPPTRARKPDGCERFATRIKKPSVTGAQQQAPAVSPVTPSLPSAPSTSSSAAAASVTLRQQQRHAAPAPTPPAAVPLEEDPEYGYLRTVLERGGFMRSSPPPPRRPDHRAFKQDYSVASPVDPIVFHLLELELPADEARLGPLRHRWNRKLLFHLAQELLAGLLLPPAAAAAPLALTGPPLLGKVWRKVRSFPAAECRVVGDIDALVAADLLESSSPAPRRMAEHPAVAEEADDVAEEVAERVLEALLGECVEESIPRGGRHAPDLTRSPSSSRAQAS